VERQWGADLSTIRAGVFTDARGGNEMLTCLSPNGATVISGAALPDRIVIATVEGAVTADRDGERFGVVARALEDRHVSSLWFEPDSETVFAASYEGGVFESDDLGMTFHPLGSALADHNVFCVAARTDEAGLTLYAGTEPVGLFVTSDRGATWTELPAIAAMPNREHWTFPGAPHVAHLKNVAFAPIDPGHLFVSIEQGGLFESHDNGMSFREVESIDQDDDDWYRDVHRLAFRPGEPTTMFISGGDGITASTDGGKTWHRVVPTSFDIGYPDGLVIHPDEPDLMFISGAHRQPGTWRESHSADAHVARTTDGGRTWTVLTGGLPDPLDANIEALSLAAAPGTSELFFATTAGEVFASNDHGERFRTVLSGLAPISKGGHYRGLVRT
jgi:photosystem II stability/assembly factor-like uncharacterized protein